MIGKVVILCTKLVMFLLIECNTVTKPSNAMRNLEIPVDGQEVQDVLEILEEVLMEEEE